jgi:membrane fusion protein, multidrug efflux system
MKRIHHLSLLLAAAATVCSCGRKTQTADGPPRDAPQRVETMEVVAMTLQETVSLVGTIAANESASLRPEVPGTIVEIPFQEGAAVAKGDILVRLDTRELEAQLAETRASFDLAKRTLERVSSLAAENAVSRLELDTATAEHARLRSAIDLLEVRIDKSTLTAPFDGFAGGRDHSVGDYLTPESVVTTVDDLSRVKVEMEVPERYLPLLQPGATFRITTATSNRDTEVTGEVYFVSPRIDATTRSTEVKGYVVDPPPFFKPGMFANITLILNTVEDALVVPESAILSTARGTVVIVPETNESGETVAGFIPVKTGIREPGIVQVTPVGPPLQAGQMVVSSGVGGLILFPGAKISPVEPFVVPGMPPITDRQLEN